MKAFIQFERCPKSETISAVLRYVKRYYPKLNVYEEAGKIYFQDVGVGLLEHLVEYIENKFNQTAEAYSVEPLKLVVSSLRKFFDAMYNSDDEYDFMEEEDRVVMELIDNSDPSEEAND